MTKIYWVILVTKHGDQILSAPSSRLDAEKDVYHFTQCGMNDETGEVPEIYIREEIIYEVVTYS